MNWLSNNPGNHPAPDSSNCLSTSPTPTERPRANFNFETTVPGGTTASLAFYKANLASRLKQFNDGHHAAFVYTSLQDPGPFVRKGPPLVTGTKTFLQTHADFHSMVQATDLGTYVFCAVCGARLQHEAGTREGVVERLEMDGREKRLVQTKLEDDDNASVDSESGEFRERRVSAEERR